MNLTLKVKLNPSEGQYTSLKTTMEGFNAACNYIGGIAFEHRMANKIELQKLVYYDVRRLFGLSAQLAVRAISKVCEAFKRDRNVQPRFRPDGAVIYDQRILSWKGIDRVSLVTVDGRIVVPITVYDYYQSRSDRIRGQADLILVDGIFYLCVLVDIPEPEKVGSSGTLGIDMGIINIATDSDGENYTGEDVERIRGKTAKLKAHLQRTGTKSAKRHLKRTKGKEQRFRHNTNHVISKKLVMKAKDTDRRIAIEDLKGIRDQTTVRRSQRNRHHSWGFYQLRSFIEYKAALAGVDVIAVDPRHTSQTCPSCGHVDRRNRHSREEFRCVNCAFAGIADTVAATNIAVRANVDRPIVSDDFMVHVHPPGTSQRL